MYFTLSQSQFLMMSLLGGLLLILVTVLIFYASRFSLRTPSEKKTEEPEHEFPDGLIEGHRSVPVVIILLWAVVVLWGIGYIIAVSKGWLHVQ